VAAEVRRMADEAAVRLGLEVVEVVFHRSGRFAQLRIDLDRPGTPGVGLDDCQRFSEELDPALEAHPELDFPYTLEVSSPGLARPIRTADDVRRNLGRRVAVEISGKVAGQSSFRGPLRGLRHGALVVEDDDAGEVLLPQDRITSAHQEIDPPRPPGRRERPRDTVTADSGKSQHQQEIEPGTGRVEDAPGPGERTRR